MFYQNNNDYMRDAFYYSQPQNTYQYNGMNNYMPMMQQVNPYSNSIQDMYPQVYRIINPVAKRVVSNNSYQYYTEDSLDNMVDTVYNIVEGDVSNLSNMTTQAIGDDTITQTSRNTSQTTNSTVKNIESTKATNNNQLLRDLIKILIIKEILSRPNNNYNSYNMNTMPQNYYDPRCGMM